MRIVDRKTFLELPSGTLFTKFPAQPEDGSHRNFAYDGEISIKLQTLGEDFVVQDLIPHYEGVNNGEEMSDIYESMLNGEESPPVDYEFCGRDGFFDQDQLFMVWSKADALAMLHRLRRAVFNGS